MYLTHARIRKNYYEICEICGVCEICQQVWRHCTGSLSCVSVQTQLSVGRGGGAIDVRLGTTWSRDRHLQPAVNFGTWDGSRDLLYRVGTLRLAQTTKFTAGSHVHVKCWHVIYANVGRGGNVAWLKLARIGAINEQQGHKRVLHLNRRGQHYNEGTGTGLELDSTVERHWKNVRSTRNRYEWQGRKP
jgi:hypothetical protein